MWLATWAARSRVQDHRTRSSTVNKSPSESMSFIIEVICKFIFTDVPLRNNYRPNKALDCLFTRCVASRLVNITMSAFVIGEKTNNKHYSTPLKTRVWLVRSRNVLTGFESEASDCPCKVGIAPLYRNSLCASLQARLLSCQVQEIVLRELRRTHSNICIVLLWNSVVNTT